MKYTEFEFTGADVAAMAKFFEGKKQAKWFVGSEVDDGVLIVNTINVKESSVKDLVQKRGLNVNVQFNSEDTERGQFSCSSYDHFGGQYYIDSDGLLGRKYDALNDLVGPVKTEKLIEALQLVENTTERNIDKLLENLDAMLAGGKSEHLKVIKVNLVA